MAKDIEIMFTCGQDNLIFAPVSSLNSASIGLYIFLRKSKVSDLKSGWSLPFPFPMHLSKLSCPSSLKQGKPFLPGMEELRRRQ